jgi:hypothetical protein
MAEKWEMATRLARGELTNVGLPAPSAEHLRVEGVGVVANLDDLVEGEEDFDDIKAVSDLGMFELAEVFVGGFDESATFAVIDGFAGTRPPAGSASLHFDEDEARFGGRFVAEDEIDLAVFAGEICSEEFQA